MDIDKNQAWSAQALDSALRGWSGDRQNLAFATALFYGTLTYQHTIDSCIKGYSKRPISKLDNSVLNILRTGFYQLLYMDSVPDHSAVDESVKLAGKLRKSSATGFINGIMRSFIRDGKSIPIKAGMSLSQRLSLEYSCPEDLVNYWIHHYGEDTTTDMLKSSVEAPPTFLRVNTHLADDNQVIDALKDEGITAELTGSLEHSLVADSGAGLNQLTAFKDGLFYQQDISSQRVGMIVSENKGTTLDCCAAPGGKAFIVAQEIYPTKVTACDFHQHRLDELESRRDTLKLDNVLAYTKDMLEFHQELGEFSAVLCDVPCSGYGTIRRNPEIKYQTLDQQKELPQLQYNLLSQGAKYCKNGGLLVYSTCTLSPRENENVVEKFLKNNPDFSLQPMEHSPNGSAMATIPIGKDGGDGFFVASMKRKP